ncbi:hypothetical protein BJX66DRAFT_4844 [Aspergillus keveii]|uniref:Uncharacterized protein n=1 Tax=Aspergillus keveii TaxID=714993 RepID=A0ABR4GRW2_9EURO
MAHCLWVDICYIFLFFVCSPSVISLTSSVQSQTGIYLTYSPMVSSSILLFYFLMTDLNSPTHVIFWRLAETDDDLEDLALCRSGAGIRWMICHLLNGAICVFPFCFFLFLLFSQMLTALLCMFVATR